MRLGIFSDIHANLPALEAVLADIAARHVDGVCTAWGIWLAMRPSRMR